MMTPDQTAATLAAARAAARAADLAEPHPAEPHPAPVPRWTAQEQAISRRILADQLLEDLQTYGPGLTLAALADALGYLIPYIADHRTQTYSRDAQLGIALWASTITSTEQDAARSRT